LGGGKVNLLEALESRGIEFKPHTSRENEVYLCCPFCTERGETPDHRFRFGVNYVTGQAHCFNCGKKFNGVEYLKKALQEKLDTGEWELSQKAIKRAAMKTPVVKLPDDFISLAGIKGKTHWDKVALAYLHRRGVTDTQIREKNIGYSMVGDFRYRIVIPVYYQGKLEGLVARAFVTDLEPKYRNSLGNKTLFNVPKKRQKTVILSEGAFDALAIERALPPTWKFDSEAVLGHTLTERQLEIVKTYDCIVLWTDPDVAGVEGLIRMGQQLTNAGKEVEIVEPKLTGQPEYEPSELEPREIRKTLQTVKRYTPEVGQSLRLKVAFLEM
jgi:DNA primase